MVFNACLKEVFRALVWRQLGIRFDGEYLSNLRFPDVIAILSKSGDELQNLIIELDIESRIVGLKFNMHKNKVMFNSHGREQRFPIGSEVVEVAREYIYLGQVLTADPNHESEVTLRIRSG